MAGRIRADVVAAVKERTSIEDVVRDHVTLRPGGIGSLKGLCPFHDEKSPSFNVRPQLGVWHCFGCGEGGDVLSFVQRVDHLTFAEAVERLAGKAGITVEYEDGGARPQQDVGRRTRLLEANRVAEQFYAEQLVEPEAVAGRQFLAERGFDREAARRFGVGFAPRSGETLTRHLRARGFTDDEIVLVGLAGRGQRGAYDRFRGRLLWPIRDVTGDCVGFGARRLFDDDRIEAKYLNTSDTPLFKKSHVLYGLDLAKKAISTQRQVVVVEGYTDVMACHLAGIDTAVATCGTAFGSDHITMVRRIMRDLSSTSSTSEFLAHESNISGQIIFTFDGDEAGQKAALRAFGEDQQFVAQTYVAVEANGLDPCELRQREGDAAVRQLVAGRVPLFEFAITSAIARFDLGSAVGRVQALRAAAPVVAQIKDSTLRPEYARRLSGLVGIDVDEAMRAVAAASRTEGVRGRRHDSTRRLSAHGPVDGASVPDDATARESAMPRPDLRDPVTAAERQLLQCVVQSPRTLTAVEFDALGADAFVAPMHRAVHEVVRELGGLAQASGGEHWVEQISEHVPDQVRPYVTDLAVAPLPVVDETGLARLAAALQVDIVQRDLVRREAEVHSRMQRLDAAGDAVGYMAALREAQMLVERRRALAAGSD